MDSITLSLYIVISIIFSLTSIVVFKRIKNIIKLKRPFIKSPKFRGKGILRDDERFGSAVIAGLEKTAPNEGFVHLISQNGIVFKEFYNAYELEPDDMLETMAGAERPVWRRKGARYSDKPMDKEKIMLESQNFELAEKLKKQEIEKKIEVNEAATLKDTVLDMMKEIKETQKVEAIKVTK